RASSMVRREPPATPAPATVRNFRRLRVLTSVILALLGCPEGNWAPRAKSGEKLGFSLCSGASLVKWQRDHDAERLCYPGQDASPRDRARGDPARARSVRQRAGLGAGLA